MSDLFSRVSHTNLMHYLDHLDKMVENVSDPEARAALRRQSEAIRSAEQKRIESQQQFEDAVDEVKKLIVEILPAATLLEAAHLGIEAGTAGFSLGRWEDK